MFLGHANAPNETQILLVLMPVLSQFLLSLMSGYLMLLSFSSARHLSHSPFHDNETDLI